MKFILVLLLSLFTVSMFACSDQSYVEEKELPQSGKLSDDNVFKDYETVLDKAEGVEQTIMDAAEKRQKEMRDQGY